APDRARAGGRAARPAAGSRDRTRASDRRAGAARGAGDARERPPGPARPRGRGDRPAAGTRAPRRERGRRDRHAGLPRATVRGVRRPMTPGPRPDRAGRAAAAVVRVGRRVPGARTVLLSPVVARPGFWFATACGWLWG